MGFSIIQHINNPFLGYSVLILLIFIGLMWDSKCLMGGNTFISPLMNYLENKESEEDRNKAKFSIFRSMVLKIPWILFFVQLKASDAKKKYTKKGVKYTKCKTTISPRSICKLYSTKYRLFHWIERIRPTS